MPDTFHARPSRPAAHRAALRSVSAAPSAGAISCAAASPRSDLRASSLASATSSSASLVQHVSLELSGHLARASTNDGPPSTRMAAATSTPRLVHSRSPTHAQLLFAARQVGVFLASAPFGTLARTTRGRCLVGGLWARQDDPVHLDLQVLP